MDARSVRLASILAALFVVCSSTLTFAAGWRTKNFVVISRDAQLARQVAETAERCRHDQAVQWLGEPLPDWRSPCPITLEVDPHAGAGGATSFSFPP